MAVLGNSIPWVKSQFHLTDGSIAASHLLFVYIAGTDIEAITYSDARLTTENVNPIVLDSAGRASIFLDRTKAYKFFLVNPKDTAEPQTSAIWTKDKIVAHPFYSIDDTALRDEVSQFDWTFSDSAQFLNAPYMPVILYNNYVDGSTTGTIDIPAGTFGPLTGGAGNSGDVLILEWEMDHASGITSARSEMFGTAVDITTGAACTHTRAKCVVYRVDNTSVYVSTLVAQNTDRTVPNKTFEAGAQTIGSLDLGANDYTVDMKMSAGTYTVRGARALFGQALPDWTAL